MAKDGNLYGRKKPVGDAGRGRHREGYGFAGGAKHEKKGLIGDCLSAIIIGVAGVAAAAAGAGYGVYELFTTIF